jgi:hypothetical protein
MAARWVAGTILLAMLSIVGIFLWAIIRPPPPPAEAAAGTPVSGEKRIEGPAGIWTLAAQAVPRADRTIVVTVSAKDIEGRPLASPTPPTAVLRMFDMAMEDERVALVQDGPGSWRGAARVSMAGRWSLRVELNGESLGLSFQALSL